MVTFISLKEVMNGVRIHFLFSLDWSPSLIFAFYIHLTREEKLVLMSSVGMNGDDGKEVGVSVKGSYRTAVCMWVGTGCSTAT